MVAVHQESLKLLIRFIQVRIGSVKSALYFHITLKPNYFLTLYEILNIGYILSELRAQFRKTIRVIFLIKDIEVELKTLLLKNLLVI